MELIKKQVHYTQEGKRTFDQFYLDEDYNVPDAKEDVQQIIQGNGNVKIEDIKLVENYIRISGKLYFHILYVTATGDPQPAVLDGKIPFEEMVYTDGGEMENYFIQNIRVEFTSNLVHSRKLSIRAMVEMEIGREKLEDEETTVDIDSPVSIYKRNETCKSIGAAYDQKRYLSNQRRNHTSWYKGKYWTAFIDRCQQQEAGDPFGAG